MRVRWATCIADDLPTVRTDISTLNGGRRAVVDPRPRGPPRRVRVEIEEVFPESDVPIVVTGRIQTARVGRRMFSPISAWVPTAS